MTEDVLALTAQIVSAHVKKNAVEAGDLPVLIRDVFRTLSGLGDSPAPVAPAAVSASAPVAEAAKPAVPATKSVFQDHIICMECGKKMTMLKRTDDRTQFDDRSVPDKIQSARNLPDGGAELRADPFLAGQENGSRQKPHRGAQEKRAA